MLREDAVTHMTDVMAKFLAFTGKRLPDDVRAKIANLAAQEEEPLAKAIYQTMTKNQELAMKLNRPSCQDTGAIQFFINCGSEFPYMAELPSLLREAVVQATKDAPLRHNAVETFDEYNTGKNVAKGIPSLFWDIVPGRDDCEIYTYMAGGGCSLPGHAKVLMPGEGYEGVTKFVLDVMTSYGLNACPSLLVGVGIGTSVEVAALQSKKASCAASVRITRIRKLRRWNSCGKTASMPSALARRACAARIPYLASTSRTARAIRQSSAWQSTWLLVASPWSHRFRQGSQLHD